MGVPGGSEVKVSACNAGDLGSIPGLGRSPGERNGNPLSILVWRIPWMEEPGRLQSMGSQRVRHNWVTSLHFPGGSVSKESACNAEYLGWSLGWEDSLEKQMATCSSILAWRSPWTEEAGGLQSMGHKESDTTEWFSLLILHLLAVH